jgi:hypothetical protein
LLFVGFDGADGDVMGEAVTALDQELTALSDTARILNE